MVLSLTNFDIKSIPTWVAILATFGPLTIGIGIFLYKTRHTRSWRKGKFPQKIPFNQGNLLEAYLSLGARMILYNSGETSSKVQFISLYFQRYFTIANYNFGDSLVFSLQHPIQIDTVTTWLKQHLEEEGQRSQVIYFLTGLALTRGKIGSREFAFLSKVNELLDLSPIHLDRVIAIYASYQQRKKTEEKKQSTGKAQSSSKLYRTILDVPENADFTTIKKAYRKLVKLHHPDVFVNASEAQQKLAEEKFVEIQKAYEFFAEKQ